MSRVFVSYCHVQGEWVTDRLVPCLRAGGAEVLIDRERFEAGKAVVGQMDAIQDAADKHLLVLSRAYLKSRYCRHEMERAIGLDPSFVKGIVIPVRWEAAPMPQKIRRPQPLYVDLADGGRADAWDKLLAACDVDLGTTAPAWLAARDQVVRFLKRNQSVNLVVGNEVRWRGLVDHVEREHLPDLARVDLAAGATVSRRALVASILDALGRTSPVPEPPEDLVVLDRILSTPPPSRLTFTHFDLVAVRPDYDVNFFSAIRNLMMDKRQLVLLVQSRKPFAALLPQDHPLSNIDIQTVGLGGSRETLSR